ncbi:MAG: hypothetical protein WBL35_07710 [Ornithinibacter sp.]
MTDLTGDSIPVPLAPGVVLTAPGLVGSAELRPGVVLRGESRGPEQARDEVIAALAATDFVQTHSVEVRAREEPSVGGDGTRTDAGEPGMRLTVPAVDDSQAQVLLLVDEFGVATWHLPDRTSNTAETSFTVERRVAPGAEGDAPTRGLFAAAAAKLLSVFVVPLLEAAVGRAAVSAARWYEDRQRPQGLRLLTPSGLRHPGEGRLDAPLRWDDGPALLFVHGTASASHSGFGSLADDLDILHQRYGGRLLAFDHHTLSADLDDNVRLLTQEWARVGPREIDIVSHSRGGLVARAVAAAAEQGRLPVTVRRVVYVSTPNDGTTLAEPENVRMWVDRMTTMLNLIPDGPWSVATDTLVGVLIVVRTLAAGAVGNLPGLVTMRPGGEVLRDLPVPGPSVEQYALDADFEPDGPLVDWMRLADGVVDRVFEDRANDVVVPTTGVTSIKGRPEFVVPADHHVSLGRTGQTWHCSMFGSDTVKGALTSWLTA